MSGSEDATVPALLYGYIDGIRRHEHGEDTQLGIRISVPVL